MTKEQSYPPTCIDCGTQNYTPEAEQAAETVIAETKQVLACKILKDIERVS